MSKNRLSGTPGVTIRTVNKIVLSLGIDITVDDFFDSHYLVSPLGLHADCTRIARGLLSLGIDITVVDS